jgi:predicted DNA-binding transcriptional regulator AlpA
MTPYIPEELGERVYLRPHQAATATNLSQSTLAKMRMRGDGPPFLKVGGRVVLYDKRDLEAWLETRRRRSTSEVA